VANFAFQVSNLSFQGSGQFAFQGSIDSGVQTPPSTFNLRGRRVKRKRRIEPEVPRETVVVELVTPVPRSSLQEVLLEMERAGFDILDTEEEDDALVLTFVLKALQ
jgi:hypothetical protein